MFVNHLRLAWRFLIKEPAFTVTAVLTLGLAIGANTAVFTIVDAELMKPLPYPQPDRLALLSREYRGAGAVGLDVGHSGAQWVAVHQQATTVDAAVTSGMVTRVNMVRNGAAVSVLQQRVSTGYFGHGH